MRILIVGAGSIGARHAANAAAAAEVGAVAVVDVDCAKARAVADSIGGLVFADVSTALDWAPDGVVIAVPHADHLALADQAVKTGARVLVEKPIATDPAAARAFVSSHAQAAASRRLLVVSNMRFHPGVEALRKTRDDIGPPFLARAHFGSHLPTMRANVDYRTVYAAQAPVGQGLIMDCIHEIDYLMELMGRVAAVSAETFSVGALEVAGEECASIRLIHEGGAISDLQLDYLAQPKRRGCELIGQHGSAVWSSIGRNPERVTFDLFLAGRDEPRRLIDSVGSDPTASALSLSRLMTAFVAECCGTPEDAFSPTIASADQGAHAVAVAAACYRAASSGRRELVV